MNKRYTWTEEYSVGVEEIDEQHKEFIRICNSLLELEESESYTQEEALIKIGQLGTYALFHLSTEEEDFKIVNYPNTTEHTEIHNKFREKVKNFEQQFRNEDRDQKLILKEIAEFAGDWLLGHILVEDKKYSKFFNENGIK